MKVSAKNFRVYGATIFKLFSIPILCPIDECFVTADTDFSPKSRYLRKKEVLRVFAIVDYTFATWGIEAKYRMPTCDQQIRMLNSLSVVPSWWVIRAKMVMDRGAALAGNIGLRAKKVGNPCLMMSHPSAKTRYCGSLPILHIFALLCWSWLQLVIFECLSIRIKSAVIRIESNWIQL